MFALHRRAQIVPLLGLGALLLLAVAPASAATPARATATATPATPASSPLLFVPNVGQFAAPARYEVMGASEGLWLTANGLVLSTAQTAAVPAFTSPLDQPPTPPVTRQTSVDLTFVGANAQPQIVAQDALPSHLSYFLGNDPRGWHADVPAYASVRYVNLYPHIDLTVSGADGALSLRLTVHAGGNAGLVRLRVEGAQSLAVLGNSLAMQTTLGPLALPLPSLTQPADTPAMAAAPAVHGDVVDSPFAWPLAPAAGRDLSPSILYATYLGGSGDDQGLGIVVSKLGNAFITGETLSANFPITPGVVQTSCKPTNECDDAFVTELNAKGSGIVFSTFLGGDGINNGNGLTLDANGNVYVVGETSAKDFPTSNPAAQNTYGGGQGDAFVTKLNPSGTALIYSTYLGGGGLDLATAVAVSSGEAYVTGRTYSSNFPIGIGGYQGTCRSCPHDSNAFVVQLNPAGSAVFDGSYLGGTTDDEATGITMDNQSYVIVTGQTESKNFPVTKSAYQRTCGGSPCSNAFVTSFLPDLSSVSFSTYLGGNGVVYGSAMAVDSSDRVYLTGQTSSTNFPTTSGAYQRKGVGTDAFVTTFNAAGSKLVYSTLLGGKGSDTGLDIVLDHSDNAYVVGRTNSTNFPIIGNAPQKTYGGGDADVFVGVFGPKGNSLLASTYYGGSLTDIGTAVALDPSGNVYFTGSTTSRNFPVSTGAFQQAFGGGTLYGDAFVVKLIAPF